MNFYDVIFSAEVTLANYKKASITNAADFQCRQELDRGDKLIDIVSTRIVAFPPTIWQQWNWDIYTSIQLNNTVNIWIRNSI